MKTAATSGLIGLILLSFTSCVTRKAVERNYVLVSDDPCDCFTRHPLIVMGTNSNYFSKEKAFCIPVDYTRRRDSISVLQDKKIQAEERLEDGAFSPDSLNALISSYDAALQNLKRGWTHAKIKTKWKIAADGEVLILKQKKVFYNKYKPGRKWVGKKIYKNDSLRKGKV